MTVTVVNFFVMLAYYLIMVTTVSYMQERFALSLSSAGASLGAIIIGCLLGRFVSGNIISMCGCRVLLFLGTVLYFLCHLSLPFLDWSALVYVQRFGLGLLMGVTGTVTGTVMAYSLPPAVQGLGVSIFSLSTAIALALGPFIGLTVVHLAGYNVLNWDTTILSLVAVVAGLCLKQAPDIQTGRKSFFQLSNYLDRDVLPFAMVAVIMTLGYGSLASYLATIAAERHLETAASIFFLVSAIVTIVTRPFTGRFFDRFGENFVIYPAIFCTAVALSLVAVAQSPWLLLVAGVFQGLGFGNFQSAGQALAIKLVAKPRIAQATSTFFIAFDLGMGLSPYIFLYRHCFWLHGDVAVAQCVHGFRLGGVLPCARAQPSPQAAVV